MEMSRLMRPIVELLLAGATLTVVPAAQAAQTVTIGTVGQASANLWPVFIGLNKGFFAAEDLKVDIVYVQSSAQLVQQITAGSLDICMSTGLVDPIRAIGMGAPIAIARVEVQAPPYALMAKPAIKNLRELKGKVISLGGPKDITRIYVERMLEPNGVKPGRVRHGLCRCHRGARFCPAGRGGGCGDSAAAIQFPGCNGGLLRSRLDDRIRQGPAVLRDGRQCPLGQCAEGHLQKLLAAHTKSVAWFEDERNRDEAVQILVAASRLKQDDVEKAYDFMRKGHFFEPTGKVSKSKLNSLAKAMVSLGDLPGSLEIERLLLPEIAQVTD